MNTRTTVREVVPKKSCGDYAARYLERNAHPEYFDAINPDTPESLAEAVAKLLPLQRHMPHPTNVVSIGVGSGEEMQAACVMYAPKPVAVSGLEISSSAAELARQRLVKYGLSGEVIEASAINMPYPPECLDAVVVSSIMHEVYSYAPEGRRAWIQVMTEIAKKTAPGGVMLLRDFAAPDLYGLVRMKLQSRAAKLFYDYFSRYFRTFTANDVMREAVVDRRVGHDEFLPKRPPIKNWVVLPVSAAAEVMLHFKNFSDHVKRGFTHLGDLHWKELNEAYLPPHPEPPGMAMPQAEYVMQVESAMSVALRDAPFQMRCVENGRSGRPKYAELLRRHFSVQHIGTDASSDEIIAGFFGKMELVFKKTQRSDGPHSIVRHPPPQRSALG